MALQLAAGRPPSLSADELREMKGELARLGAGFESSLLEYPDLVSGDGRQDFLHYFLYPLIVAPAVPIVNMLGLHPNWAFTLVNAMLLAGAVLLIARREPLVACVAGFVSPIVWWVDKAHTEVFLFATVGVAALLFRHHPSLALIAFALAGAQNAAIGVTYPAFGALLWAATRRSTFTPRTWVAAAAGAAIVASPFLYTWIRLGRLSPMAEYAQRAVPSIGGIAAFVAEPNIGVLPNAPMFGLALIAAGWLWLGLRQTPGSRPSFWWWPAVIQALLLLVWSQNPNVNHGGTPGMNRWVLSLLALSLPWMADAHRSLGASGRRALTVVVAVISVGTAALHLPARPERYREPTRLAASMWSAGMLQVTPAEVFAERSDRREPAFVPVHDGACEVLLIANQQAPVQCAPPADPLPSHCRRAGAMCYAIPSADGTRYLAAPTNGFYHNVAEPSWPAGGPLAAGMNRVLREADPDARVWRVESAQRWRERLGGADIGVVLSADDVVVIYVTRAAEGAVGVIASHPGVRVYSLIPFGAVDHHTAPRTNLAVVVQK